MLEQAFKGFSKTSGLRCTERSFGNCQIFGRRNWCRIGCDDCGTRKGNLELHYHCKICSEGDFDLCQNCVDKGITCENKDHITVKRFVKNDEVFDYDAIGNEQEDIMESMEVLEL